MRLLSSFWRPRARRATSAQTPPLPDLHRTGVGDGPPERDGAWHANCKALHELIRPDRLTEVLDIGANPIDGTPPYSTMLQAGLCRVTGFEPQAAALEELLQNRGPNEAYLPYAIGDGNTHTLNICRASGMTSLLEPDPAALKVLEFFRPLSDIKERVEIKTHRLDELDDIQHVDFLKIDIQGGELDAIRSGKRLLAQTCAIQIEVSFLTLYKDQAPFGQVDLELRSMGFLPHCFVAVKKWPLGAYRAGEDRRQPLNQLLEADVLYMRDITRPDLLADEQLKHLALVAHCCYGSYDLAQLCLDILETRCALQEGTGQSYLALLQHKT